MHLVELKHRVNVTHGKRHDINCDPPSLPPSGKPLKLPLRSGVLLGLDLAEDFVGDIVLEASAYAVDLDGRERATRGNSRWKKKALKIQACSLIHEKNKYLYGQGLGFVTFGSVVPLSDRFCLGS